MSENEYLLDTQILLWTAFADSKLPTRYTDIVSRRSGVWVSVVSVWEIALKRSVNKLTYPGDVFETVRRLAIPILPILEDHARAVEFLPYHHRDPFDRMIIAQARIEGLTILTTDRHFAQYDVALA